MKQEIHISDLKQFLTCRRRWDWSSLMRQGMERKVTYAPFFTGRAIHWCLEKYYESIHTEPEPRLPHLWLTDFLDRELPSMEKDVGNLWDREEDVFEEQVELIQGMLEHYGQWAPVQRDWFSDSNLRFIALETEFSVPLRTQSGRASSKVYLAGRFDGLVQRKDNGTYWLLETKTTRSVDQLQASLDNDFQCGAYLLAAQELFGLPISGVLYNLMRKKVPTVPRLLSSGTLSQDQRIDTTAFAYMEAINQVHPDWTGEQIEETYGGFLKHLLDSKKDFFRRVPIRRTPNELASLGREIHMIALEMSRPEVPIYANGAAVWRACDNCPFKAPCLAMNAGADFGQILSQEYRSRRRWDPLEGEEFSNGTESYTVG